MEPFLNRIRRLGHLRQQFLSLLAKLWTKSKLSSTRSSATSSCFVYLIFCRYKHMIYDISVLDLTKDFIILAYICMCHTSSSVANTAQYLIDLCWKLPRPVNQSLPQPLHVCTKPQIIIRDICNECSRGMWEKSMTVFVLYVDVH